MCHPNKKSLTQQDAAGQHAHSPAEAPPPRTGGDAPQPRPPHSGRRCPSQAPSSFSWRWGPNHRSMPRPREAKTGNLLLHKSSNCGGVGSSAPHNQPRHDHHQLRLQQHGLVEATSDGQVKGAGPYNPKKAPTHLLASARRARGWSRPQDRAPSSSEPALFDFRAQTRCFGTCCQHDRRR